MITPQQQKLMNDLQWGYLLQFRKLIYSRCKRLPKSYREDVSIREDFVQHCYLGALIILKNPKINDTDSAIVDWIANYATKEFIRRYNKERTAKVPLSVATLPFPIADPNLRRLQNAKKVTYAQKGNVDLERIASGVMVASDIEPPPLNWSTTMFRKRRTRNGKQATEARRDRYKVTPS